MRERAGRKVGGMAGDERERCGEKTGRRGRGREVGRTAGARREGQRETRRWKGGGEVEETERKMER